MASAGAQCNHVVHVNTQLPYVLLVAAVSFAAYVVTPFVGTAWVALPIAVILMMATLFFLRLGLRGAIPEEDIPTIFRKFAQHVGSGALATAINRMARAILADGKIDMAEAAQLQQFLKGLEGQNEFRKALADARADGIITMEESANLENFLRKLIK